MSEKKPLACPFCGAAPNVTPWHGGPKTKHAVICENDDCSAAPMVTGPTKELAIDYWDDRSAESILSNALTEIIRECNRHGINGIGNIALFALAATGRKP